MIDDLPASRHICRNQRPGHRRRLEQRARQSFAVGWQHDRAGLRDERPHIIGGAEILDLASRNPTVELRLADRRAITWIDRPKELELRTWQRVAEHARRRDKFADAFVAKKTRDQQEG